MNRLDSVARTCAMDYTDKNVQSHCHSISAMGAGFCSIFALHQIRNGLSTKRPVMLSLFVLLAITAWAQTEDYLESGVASYYHDKFVGRKTANGERFSQKLYTCAHKNLPFGTRLKVTNLDNGKSVTVIVNDRGPYVRGRVIDLSRRAASDLDFVKKGLARVAIEVAPQETEPADEQPAYLVLNDSIRSLYCIDTEKPYTIKMGDYESEQQVKEVALAVSRQSNQEVLVQVMSDSDDTTYLVFVGVFYRQDDAEDFLDRMEQYYPEAQVTKLSTALL